MSIPRVYKYMTPSPHSIGRVQTLATEPYFVNVDTPVRDVALAIALTP